MLIPRESRSRLLVTKCVFLVIENVCRNLGREAYVHSLVMVGNLPLESYLVKVIHSSFKVDSLDNIVITGLASFIDPSHRSTFIHIHSTVTAAVVVCS